MKKFYFAIPAALLLVLSLAACAQKTDHEDDDQNYIAAAKPVIYLYPETKTDVTVQLDFNGQLTSTYPHLDSEWTVEANPDGTLVDTETGREYYCLFWEGKTNTRYDMSKGFVVEGKNTAAFLEYALKEVGLTDKEANEFIIYWLPKMENSPYNLISFQGDTYTDNAVLDITPRPDSILRVFMAWKPLDEYIDLPAQHLDTFERKGFTVVEWGGAEVR